MVLESYSGRLGSCLTILVYRELNNNDNNICRSVEVNPVYGEDYDGGEGFKGNEYGLLLCHTRG